MFMHLGRLFTATEKSLQRVFRSLFRGVLRGLSSVGVLFEMVVYALADAFLIIIFLIRLVASFRAFLRTVALTEKGGKHSSLSFVGIQHSSNVPSRMSLQKSCNSWKGCLRRSVNAPKVLPRRRPALSLAEWIEH
jgi:hypothetical protein